MLRKVLATGVVAVCSVALAMGAESVTLIGCLKAGKKQKNFTLTNVAGDVATYRLAGKSGLDLKTHVGHKVALTGVLVPRPNAKTKAKGKIKTAADRLNVTAIKH